MPTQRNAAPLPHVEGFRSLEEIGAGAFARVIRAERLADGLLVALKVAHAGDPAAEIQLAAEARVLAAIGAPAAPALLGETRDEMGSLALALELIPWPSLATLRRQEPRPTLARILSLADAALGALEAVHARGFAHLDFKPANLLVREESPAARLVDFALAGPDPAVPSSPDLGSRVPASSAFVAGTADAMAPEQCAGGVAGKAADVYAAGVLLFELLTGRLPFLGSAAEVRLAHQGQRPPRPSTLAPVAPVLDELVLRCLAKEPAQRFPDAGSLRVALATASTTLGQPLAGNAGLTASQPNPEPALGEGAGGPDRRRVALLFFLSQASLSSLRSAVEATGGILGQATRGRAVAVYEAGTPGGPVDRAVRAAETLIARGLADRARVDLGEVQLQRRGSGPPRVLSAAFAQDDRYPTRAEPAGPILTSAALAGLPGQAVAPATTTSADLWRLSFTQSSLLEPAQPNESPLVGRDSMLERLVASARRALADRQPALSVLLGDGGVGKSHLSAALAQTLRETFPYARVIELSLRQPMAGVAEEALRALLEITLERRTGEPPERTRDHLVLTLGPELAEELWPAVALGLGLVAEDDARLQKLRAAPGALRTLSVRALGELLRMAASRTPLCILLDDAHFADDAALDALEYAALAESAAPLWIFACARPSFEQARRGFGERAVRREVLRLEPLGREAAVALCKTLLLPAENTPAEAIARLVERTHGIPLLLVELIRGLKREGLVRRASRGQGAWLATDSLDRLPDLPLIDWLAEREVFSLPPDLAAHARLAALLGAEFTAEEAEGVLAELDRERAAGEFPLDVRVGNQRLVTAGLLTTGPGDTLRYRHALIRDAVEKAAPAAQKRAIHRAATRFYRIGGSAPRAGRLALLAWHAALAEDDDAPGPLRAEAASLYLELAERARERHAFLEAEIVYSRALELLSPGDLAARLQAHRGRGDTRFRIGRSEGSLDDFKQARALAEASGATGASIDILLDEATALDWLNDLARSSERVDEAKRLSASLPQVPPPMLLRLQMAEGRSLFRASRWELACTSLERAAALAEPLGDSGYETLIAALTMLEVVLPARGRVDEAARVADRAIALARERHDLLHLASALNNRRNLHIARKDLVTAIADQQRFMRIGRELGIVLSEYFGEYNLGELLYYAGDLASAERHILRAIEIEAAHPEVAPRPIAVLLRARLLAYAARNDEARALISTIQASVSRAAQEAVPGGALAPSESVLLAAVDLATRDASSEEWAALLARSERDSMEQEPIEIRELRAWSLLRRGLTQDAGRAFADALEVAARIPNILEPRVQAGLESSRTSP